MNAIGIVSCVGFVALLVCHGLLAHWRAARRSRWDRLGRRYPAGGRPVGVRFPRATIRINGRPYPEYADIRIGGGGLRIGLPPLFRPFHPPLLLPWDDLTPADVTPDGDLPLAIEDSAEVRLSGPAAQAAVRVLARRNRSRALRPGRQ